MHLEKTMDEARMGGMRRQCLRLAASGALLLAGGARAAQTPREEQD